MDLAQDNIFEQTEAPGRILRGIIVGSDAPWIAELAGRVGFEAVWIDMEHSSADFSQAQTLCLAAEAGGAIPAVRVSGCERSYILRALEVGARLVIVPMVNSSARAVSIPKRAALATA